MKITKHGVRKDMGDLKKDVIDTAKTVRKLTQDKLHDVKTEIRSRVPDKRNTK